MTVALTDTQLLCDMLRPLPDFSDALKTADTTAAFYTRRKPLSATINTLANALYQARRCSQYTSPEKDKFQCMRWSFWPCAGGRRDSDILRLWGLLRGMAPLPAERTPPEEGCLSARAAAPLVLRR